jgi:hypothetical protein
MDQALFKKINVMRIWILALISIIITPILFIGLVIHLVLLTGLGFMGYERDCFYVKMTKKINTLELLLLEGCAFIFVVVSVTQW